MSVNNYRRISVAAGFLGMSPILASAFSTGDMSLIMGLGVFIYLALLVGWNLGKLSISREEDEEPPQN